MTTRVGINGFGRMGRLGLRAGWNFNEFNVVRVNETYFSSVRGAMIMEDGKWQIPSIKGKGAGGEAWCSVEQDLKYQKVPRFQIFGKQLKLNQLLAVIKY